MQKILHFAPWTCRRRIAGRVRSKRRSAGNSSQSWRSGDPARHRHRRRLSSAPAAARTDTSKPPAITVPPVPGRNKRDSLALVSAIRSGTEGHSLAGEERRSAARLDSALQAHHRLLWKSAVEEDGNSGRAPSRPDAGASGPGNGSVEQGRSANPCAARASSHSRRGSGCAGARWHVPSSHARHADREGLLMGSEAERASIPRRSGRKEQRSERSPAPRVFSQAAQRSPRSRSGILDEVR